MTCIAGVYRFNRQHHKHVDRPELFIEHRVVADKSARAQIAFYERGQFAPCAPYVNRISGNQSISIRRDERAAARHGSGVLAK